MQRPMHGPVTCRSWRIDALTDETHEDIVMIRRYRGIFKNILVEDNCFLLNNVPVFMVEHVVELV